MKKKLLSCVLVLFFASYLFADEDPDLKLNANTVVENYQVELTIVNQWKAILEVKTTKLILNKNGNKHALFAEYYDKFRKIRSFSGKILDSNNKIIKRLSYLDLIDRSLISNFSLYEDNRIKYYKPQQKNYPYRIQYTYKIELNGLLSIPVWQPLESSQLSVKKATFEVIQDEKNAIRYKLNQVEEPEIQTVKNKLIYKWEVENIEARKIEPYRLPYLLTSPTVQLAPNDFIIDYLPGNMSSWENYGKWIYELGINRQALPEEAIVDVNNLIKDEDNEIEKVKLIYNYMQSRTRYVSIQVGIGGWQPFDATTVHNLGYGDCKALSNYTKALLKAVGIKSYYAVIRAGINNGDIQTDFPSNQFNHAILCVPLQNDSIWLECTSQTAPFGYLGDFTANKHALLISEEGGKIVKTTNYSKEDNLQKRFIVANLNDDASATASINTFYHGLQYDNISYLIDKSKVDQKEALLKKLELSNFTIDEFKINNVKPNTSNAYDSLQLTINNYSNTNSTRMFFTLNMLNKNEYVPIKLENRISPIRFNYPYTDIDSIEYYIPDNFNIEYVPESFTSNTQFGEYSIDIKTVGNKIIYTRKLSMNKDIFPPEDYNDLVTFFEEIVKQDKAKCVLKKIN